MEARKSGVIYLNITHATFQTATSRAMTAFGTRSNSTPLVPGARYVSLALLSSLALGPLPSLSSYSLVIH